MDPEVASDGEPDAWTVRHTPAECRSGWHEIEGYERLDEPVIQETFEWNNLESELVPGRYRLFALYGNRLARPTEDVGWKLPVEAHSVSHI